MAVVGGHEPRECVVHEIAQTFLGIKKEDLIVVVVVVVVMCVLSPFSLSFPFLIPLSL